MLQLSQHCPARAVFAFTQSVRPWGVQPLQVPHPLRTLQHRAADGARAAAGTPADRSVARRNARGGAMAVLRLARRQRPLLAAALQPRDARARRRRSRQPVNAPAFRYCARQSSDANPAPAGHRALACRCDRPDPAYRRDRTARRARAARRCCQGERNAPAVLRDPARAPHLCHHRDRRGRTYRYGRHDPGGRHASRRGRRRSADRAA